METENRFLAGMNLDDDLRDLEPGFYRYLRNGTTNSTSAQSKGAAENLLSWTAQTKFWYTILAAYGEMSLPPGTNTCIAVCKDIKNNAIIWFNKNSNGNHAIFRYWINPLNIEPFVEALSFYIPGFPPVSWGSTLNFTVNMFNPFVVETGRIYSGWPGVFGNGHPVFGTNIPEQLVFFTDNVLPQRRLNTTDLYRLLTASTPNAFNATYLNVGQIQGGLGILTIMQTASNRKTNFLPYHHYQFAFRFHYKGGEYVPLNPYSNITMLWKNEYFFLNFDRAIVGDNNYNYVNLTMSDIPGPTVDKIEWFVRQGNGVGDTNTNPEWYRFMITEGNDRSAQYFGDEETIPLSQIDGRTDFYAIPQRSAQQEIVSGNQVVYGNITEGYDEIGVEGSVAEISKSVQSVVYEGAPKILGISSSPYSGEVHSVSDREPGDVVYGFYDIASVPLPGSSPVIITAKLPYSYVLTSGDIADIDVFGTNIAAAIASQSGYPITYNSGTNKLLIGIIGPRAAIFDQSGWSYVRNNPINCFKEGATHKFGIVHMDEFMRQGAFEEIGDLYIPFVVERYPIASSYLYIPKAYGAALTVTSLPPTWAKYYKFVHKCNVQKSAQFIANDFSYVDGKLQMLVKSYKNFVDGNNIGTFNGQGVVDFQYTEWAGNRIRFVTQSAPDFGISSSVRSIMASYVDVQVLSVTLDGSGYLKVIISDFGYPSSGIDVNTQFEVYKVGYEPVYFELPMNEYESATMYGSILNPGTNTRAYDFGSTYNTYMGNTYKKWRSLTNGGQDGRFHIDTFSISDWWASEFYSRGRVQPETPNMKAQTLFSMRRWTGKLFQNTNVNNTNVFDEGNYDILEQKYGAITGLRMVGYTLKTLQWANCSSTFINRREIQNADGSTQLVVTDSLLGTVNYSEDLYGCKHPASVYVKDRDLYFFDVLNKCMVRNDPNGSDNISGIDIRSGRDHKAGHYWIEIADLIGDYDGSTVITGWDQQNKLLYCLIIYKTEFWDCISYAPNKGYWNGFHDHCDQYPIEMYGDCQSSIVAFYGGAPWLMNDGPTYNGIIGFTFKFIASAAASVKDKVAVFKNHAVRSNIKLASSEQFIPASDINPNGQASLISAGQYDYRESVYYAATNRNFMRFGQPATDAELKNGLINGDQLRGHACEFKVIFDGDDFVILYSMSVGFVFSEKS